MKSTEHDNKKSLNVLVVDDGEIELKLMSYFVSQISDWDINCFQANCANDAIGILQSTSIDVCLFDYYLAGETGVELVNTLIEMGINKPVVMVTGLDEAEVDTLIHSCGIEHTLSKENLSPSSIAQSIHRAIEH
ncbi:response regulator [Glaciecola sp. SC05]|uniref:response regulator n=1 Tax=Glaciecola sp. SC05 TaxID=1987355 RepID=UPI003527F144